MDIIGVLNYIRGDISCLILLSYLFIKVVSRRIHDRNNHWFLQVIAWVMIYITVYSLSGTFKYGYIAPSSALYNGVVTIVMISQTMVAYCWYVYSELKQEAAWTDKKMNFWLAFAPAGLFCLASLFSVKTKWIFYIDENLTYHRGALFLVQYIIIAAYMGLTAIKALVKSRKKENYVQKGELFTIFTFIIPPAVMTAFQAVIPMGIFLVGYGFTMAVLMVYLNSTQEQVSQDGLTKLNNRTHMSRFLQRLMVEKNDRLYLLVIDANSFKAINDTYGHVEGDLALKRIAKALTTVGHKESCYISRYGGDEFVIVKEADHVDEVENLCNLIYLQLQKENEEAQTPYKLSVSIGYAKYNDSIKTIPDFIQAADEQLLIRKAKYHKKSL